MPKDNNSPAYTKIMNKVHTSNNRSIWVWLGIASMFLFGYLLITNRTKEVDHFGVHEITSGIKVKVLTQTNLPNLSAVEIDALPKSTFNYLAMIDAGSSGCRVHVYRYGRLGSNTGPLYVLAKDKAKKVKPGLSTFANNYQEAGPSLKGLVEFIKLQVPEDMWTTTPIFLKATAGLRMLSTQQSDAILNSVRQYLSNSTNSPFYFRPSYAKLISGNEEGAYGWISFNYMKRIIGPLRDKVKKEPTYAVVEMGGASAQVSQLVPSPNIAAEIPVDYKFTFRLEDDVYTLYTHSYLGYGLEQAREKVNTLLLTKVANSTVYDPCLNQGYKRSSSTPRESKYEGPDGALEVIGAADGKDSCSKIVDNIFPANQECPFGPEKPYSFNCVYQPKFIKESQNVLVFENFYYIASGVDVPSVDSKSSGKNKFPLQVTPASYAKASEAVCGASWSDISTSYPKDGQGKDNNVKWCFGSTYAEKFVTKGLGFSSDKVVTISKEVDDSEIEWALGAAYKEALEFASDSHLRTGISARK